ncbi:MAG TPA: RNA polymerase sigma factor [Chitinophaga sp.]|nr:RNA polymerase sigma factor [Chitinophaga sp.]
MIPLGQDNEALIKRLNNDDEEAFHACYHQYHHAVFANICRLIQQQEEAEDILQEVFLALWESRHKLTPKHSVAGWLFTTSYYKTSAYIRKSLREKIAPLQENLHEVPDEQSGIEVLFQERLSLINAAMEELPGRKKLAFQLCRLEGKSYEEAAEILGVSIQSVKDYVKSSSLLIKKKILSENPAIPFITIYLVIIFLQC